MQLFMEFGNSLKSLEYNDIISWCIGFAVTVVLVAPGDEKHTICYSFIVIHCIINSALPNCREEIPPHASVKSPLSSFFRSGVQGEWSDTTMSMCPAFSADHNCSCEDKSNPKWTKNEIESCWSTVHPLVFTWLADPRMGGQHLNCVAPAGMFSAHRVR